MAVAFECQWFSCSHEYMCSDLFGQGLPIAMVKQSIGLFDLY